MLKHMNEMVEMVALALCNIDNKRFDLPLLTSIEEFRFDHDRSVYEDLARAAIEAMHDPTEAMVAAGCRHENMGDMAGRFNAMIDAALATPASERT